MKYFKLPYIIIIALLGFYNVKTPKDNSKFESDSNLVDNKIQGNTDEQVLNELIKIINSSDLKLFDKIYLSAFNKQDEFIDIGNKTLKVVYKNAGVNLFDGVAFGVKFYFDGEDLIMIESTPADKTFSKIEFDKVIKSSPIYSLVMKKGNMTIYNEYFSYKDVVINTWRPTKVYEFKSNGVYDDFTYNSNDIYFMTITRKKIFVEMIEPMLKSIGEIGNLDIEKRY